MKNSMATLLKLTFHFFVITFRLFGLLPYSYSSSNRCFHPSTFWLGYSAIFAIFYIVTLGFYTIEIYWYIRTYHPEYGILFIVATFGMWYICPIVTYAVTLAYYKRLRTLLNTSVRLWHLLRSGSPDHFDRKLLSCFLFKAIAIDGSSVMTSVSIRMAQAVDRRNASLVFQALSSGFSYALAALTLDLFVIAAYLGAHYFRLINCRVRDLKRKLKDFEQNKHYWRLNPRRKTIKTKELVSELKNLSLWHGEVTRLIQDFVQLHDASLLIMTVKSFIIVVTGAYLTYVQMVTQLRQNTKSAVGIVGSLTLTSAFHFSQFCYLTESGALFFKRGEKTGSIMEDMSKQEYCEQLEIKFEAFGLELLHRSSKIWISGVFTVDYSLMYAAMATMANYLILSIQFQMSE